MKRINLFLLLLITLLFFVFSYSHIADRGTRDDEVELGIFAVNVLRGGNYVPIDDPYLSFGKFHFPLNFIQSYVFALANYLILPFFYIFGINIIALRLLPIICATLSLPLVYFITSRLFSKKVALVTVLLLAVNSGFVFDSIYGLATTEPILNFLFWGSILLFILYRDKGKNFFLYLSVFFFSLGFSLKLTILWRVVGLLVAGIIVFPAKIKSMIFNISPRKVKKILFCLLVFACGASLCIIYNLSTGFDTLHEIVEAFSTISYGGTKVNNFDFINNIQIRLRQFHYLINSTAIEYVGYSFAGEQNENPILANIPFFIFILSLISNIVFILVSKAEYRKWLLFAFIFYFTMLWCSQFTLFTLRPFQLYALFFLVPLSIACSIDMIVRYINQSKLKRTLKQGLVSVSYLLILIPLLFSSLFMTLRYHSFLKDNEHRDYLLSRTIFDLTSYLKNSDDIDNLIIFQPDKHLHPAIYVLTGGKIVPEICNIQSSLAQSGDDTVTFNEFIRRLDPKRNAYLLLTYFDIEINKNYSTPPNLLPTKEIAKSNNMYLRLEKIFYDRRGNPLYALYKIERGVISN